MNLPKEKEAEYGKLTVKQLKDRLATIGAKLGGRKKELIERLILYELNANFGHEPVDDVPDERMKTPVETTYKDLHAGCPMPAFTQYSLLSFLKRYEKRIDEGQAMYTDGYLLLVRFTMPNDVLYYVKGRCKAMMKKIVQYQMDASMTMEGEIRETSCECTAGNSVTAHCKHVIILLLAVADMCTRKDMVFDQTCTQKLQKFHRPSKKFNDSPQEAEDFINKKRRSRKRTFESNDADGEVTKKAVVFQNTEDYKMWYINYFRNVIINNCHKSAMPMTMIVPPAYVHAANLDHTYSCYSLETKLLRKLKLMSVTPEEILEIEYETRGQSNNPKWHFHRSLRISASKFHKACHITEEGVEKFVSSILHPKSMWSLPTMHGIQYEPRAVDDYNAYNLGLLDLKECGLFVSKDHPFICGTPDRLLCYVNLLEVKCPYSSRHYMISEVTVPYLGRDQDGYLRLKKKHPYYYQVQGQMLVTNRAYCDFVVWTFVDMHHKTIERDPDFIQEMLKKLIDFYDKHLKPAILEKYLYRNTDNFCSCPST
ncbi:hypothetical protein QAD02_003109 [Eretmocerus hayati]|uniref:Uncharacterized protein n=1 Tax=Eretmocerus hayati TaxID=131215 RepID=A0ACC2NQN0_9HYME|nr:hypothetical protein QAD02_003109 [Eretmocerus hayati]